jgi:hypothetical protein
VSTIEKLQVYGLGVPGPLKSIPSFICRFTNLTVNKNHQVLIS